MTERSPEENSERSAPSGKPLLIVAALLVVGAIAAFFAVLPGLQSSAAPPSPPSSERAPVAVTPSLPSPAVPATIPVPSPSSTANLSLPPVDLFQGDAPEIIRMGKEVIDRGTPIASHKLKEIFQFAKDHPNDARGYLLMGEDAMNRKWFGFAAEHYESAQKADPRARQDPHMLADLVRIAGEPESATEGAKLLTSIYGSYAVTAVEDAIAAADGSADRARVERLTALSSSLAASRPVP